MSYKGKFVADASKADATLKIIVIIVCVVRNDAILSINYASGKNVAK